MKFSLAYILGKLATVEPFYAFLPLCNTESRYLISEKGYNYFRT